LEDVETNKKTSRKRRWWTYVKTITSPIDRQFSYFNNRRIYPENFFQYYRLSVISFEELLGLIGENIVKQDTIMRQNIHPAERDVIF